MLPFGHFWFERSECQQAMAKSGQELAELGRAAMKQEAFQDVRKMV
jgi:hypothetical protein